MDDPSTDVKSQILQIIINIPRESDNFTEKFLCRRNILIVLTSGFKLLPQETIHYDWLHGNAGNPNSLAPTHKFADFSLISYCHSKFW